MTDALWHERPRMVDQVNENLDIIRQCRAALPGSPAEVYLEKRGVTPAEAQAFDLGFFPKDWEVQNVAPAMSGRLVIPIYDVWGTPVALTGRDIEGWHWAKYYNTHYRKGDHWFHLYAAASAIQERGFVYLVEGQLDAVALWGQGVENVLALQGNAGVSWVRACLLYRYTDKVVVLADNDEGGKDTLKKVRQALARPELSMQVTKLPVPETDGMGRRFKDVDELIRSGSPEAAGFCALLREVVP